jgi:hypothetical protein
MQAMPKKHTFTALFMLLACKLPAQLGFFNRDLPILSHRLEWNTSTNTYDSAYRFIADYDVNGRLTRRQLLQPGTAGWELTFQREVRYVGQGDSTIHTLSVMQMGNWFPYDRTIDTEDSDGRRTSSLHYVDNNGLQLRDGTRYTHTLDANGRLESTLVQTYDDQADSWSVFQLIQYQYNVGSSTPETAFTSLNTATGWRPLHRDINFQWYNFARLKAKAYTRQSWDGSGYVNIERYDCTFGPYDYKRCSTDRWESNAWVPYQREKNLVDTAGHFTDQGMDQYDRTTGTWQVSWWTKYLNTYSGAYLAESEVSDWTSGTAPANPTHKYVFVNYALSSPAVTAEKPLIAYPQPAGDRLYLQSDLRGPLRLRVHDLQGRQVMEVSQDAIRLAEAGVDVRQLPDGIYLLQVLHSKSTHAVRILVQH